MTWPISSTDVSALAATVPGVPNETPLTPPAWANGLDEPLLLEVWAWVVVDPPRGERLTAVQVSESWLPMVAPAASWLQEHRGAIVDAVRATGLTHRLLVIGPRGRVCVEEMTPQAVAEADERAELERLESAWRHAGGLGESPDGGAP